MGFLDHLFGKKEEPVVIDLEIFNERLASAQEPLEPDALYSSDQAQRNIVAHRLNQRDQVIDTLSHLKRAGHQTYDDPVKGLQVKRR